MPVYRGFDERLFGDPDKRRFELSPLDSGVCPCGGVRWAALYGVCVV